MRSRVPRFMVRNGWTWWHFAAAIVTMGAAVAAMFDAWADLFRIALRQEEMSHILLVPAVAAWLAWVRRGRLRHCRPEGTLVGPALVAAGWLFYSFGDLVLFESFWHFGAVLALVGAFLSVAGVGVLRRFFAAFAVLVFLVPIPGTIRQTIAIPLMDVSARATQGVLDVIGIVTERAGNVLIIKAEEVTIAEACNGLRMVFALVLVSFAFAFGTPLRAWVRLVILLLCPVSAIVCNVIRLVPTVWIYGNASSETAKLFHDISGWVMLPVAFLLLLIFVRLLRWAMVPVYRYTLAYGTEG